MQKETATEKVFNQLPETFTRMDVKRLMFRLGYNPASNQPVIEQLTISNQIERISHGKYAKVNACN